MHSVQVKGILFPGNGMNLYRGCRQRGIWHDNDRIFRYMHTLEEKTEQMSFL